MAVPPGFSLRFIRFALIAPLLVLPMGNAQAGAVIERIKAQNLIRCGGAPRPGLVGVAPDGRAFGLYLDVCRAIGAALLGADGRIEFQQYDSDKAHRAAREGAVDVSFLSGSEIVEAGLADRVVPGPAIYFASTAVMVAGASPVRHVGDLAGKTICFPQGANSHRHLEAWFAQAKLDFTRMGYQEDVEMFDAYAARQCEGLAGESTVLAAVRRAGAARALDSRILPEPLAVFPIVAATPTSDAQWSAIVAWAVYSLQRADVAGAAWAAGGLESLPLRAPELGLADDWQARVVGAAGAYGDIFRRNLGEDSPLKLPRGPNAPMLQGGLFAPPYVE